MAYVGNLAYSSVEEEIATLRTTADAIRDMATRYIPENIDCKTTITFLTKLISECTSQYEYRGFLEVQKQIRVTVVQLLIKCMCMVSRRNDPALSRRLLPIIMVFFDICGFDTAQNTVPLNTNN